LLPPRVTASLFTRATLLRLISSWHIKVPHPLVRIRPAIPANVKIGVILKVAAGVVFVSVIKEQEEKYAGQFLLAASTGNETQSSRVFNRKKYLNYAFQDLSFR